MGRIEQSAFVDSNVPCSGAGVRHQHYKIKAYHSGEEHKKYEPTYVMRKGEKTADHVGSVVGLEPPIAERHDGWCERTTERKRTYHFLAYIRVAKEKETIPKNSLS